MVTMLAAIVAMSACRLTFTPRLVHAKDDSALVRPRQVHETKGHAPMRMPSQPVRQMQFVVAGRSGLALLFTDGLCICVARNRPGRASVQALRSLSGYSRTRTLYRSRCMCKLNKPLQKDRSCPKRTADTTHARHPPIVSRLARRAWSCEATRLWPCCAETGQMSAAKSAAQRNGMQAHHTAHQHTP